METKKTKTTKKKSTKPSFICTVDNSSTPEELRVEIIRKKVAAGLTITSDDLQDYTRYAIELFSAMVSNLTFQCLCEFGNSTEQLSKIARDKNKKQKNIFKRFWNWLTNKK